MSFALNIIPNNFQGYAPSETSSLPCLGVSGRGVSISSCPRSEVNSFKMKVISSKHFAKRMSLVCRANSGGHRRNSDFSKQHRRGYSRSRNRFNEDRDNSENLDESEFLSTKNGPILSLSNSPKSHATAAPGPKEREIVELFRKVQAQLRERAAVKEEKKFEAVKGQKKESETVDSLLNLLRKHSAEQGKRKENGDSSSESSFDRPRQSGQSDEDKSRGFFTSDSIVKEEPQETIKPSPSRPVSSFRRRSPVPRVKYEPIISTEDTYRSVSPSDLHGKTTKTYAEADLESESDSEPDMDIKSGVELEEEEQEDAPEIELTPEAEFVDETEAGELPEVEALHAEEDDSNSKDNEKQHTGIKDWSAMKLTELRAVAKARGMKGFSKLKKSELVGILGDDSMYP